MAIDLSPKGIFKAASTPFVGATAFAFGAVGGFNYLAAQEQAKANKEQNKAEKRARAIQNRQAEIQNQRARNRAIAQARSLSATNIATGAAQGASGSSSLAGVLSGGESSLQSALGFQNSVLAANFAQSTLLQAGANRAVEAQNRAAQYQAFGNVTQQAASIFAI